jgi:hypothetical protein
LLQVAGYELPIAGYGSSKGLPILNPQFVNIKPWTLPLEPIIKGEKINGPQNSGTI